MSVSLLAGRAIAVGVVALSLLSACGSATRPTRALARGDELSRAHVALMGNDCVGARELALASLRKRPVAAEAYYVLGVCAEIEGRVGVAVAHFQDALAADPACIPAALHLAALFLDSGRYEEAARIARAGLQRHDEPELHLVLATALERSGEHALAAKAFTCAADSFARAVAEQSDKLLRSHGSAPTTAYLKNFCKIAK